MRVSGRKDMNKALHMRLEDQQWVKLDLMAKGLGLTRAEVIRRLIDVARYSPVVVDADMRRPNGSDA